MHFAPQARRRAGNPAPGSCGLDEKHSTADVVCCLHPDLIPMAVAHAPSSTSGDQVLDIVAGLVTELGGGAARRPTLDDSLDRDLGYQQPRTCGAVASPRASVRRSPARFGDGRSRHAKRPGDRDSSRRSRSRGTGSSRASGRDASHVGPHDGPLAASTRCAGTPNTRPSASTSTCATTTAPRRPSRTANS